MDIFLNSKTADKWKPEEGFLEVRLPGKLVLHEDKIWKMRIEKIHISTSDVAAAPTTNMKYANIFLHCDLVERCLMNGKFQRILVMIPIDLGFGTSIVLDGGYHNPKEIFFDTDIQKLSFTFKYGDETAVSFSPDAEICIQLKIV